MSHAVFARERHFELIKLTMDRPEIAYFVDDSGLPGSLPQRLNVNLWIGHWFLLWKTGEISEEGLRRNFGAMFSNPVARAWWSVYGSTWTSQNTRRSRTFIKLADEACEKVESMDSKATRSRRSERCDNGTVAVDNSSDSNVSG
ncbi:DUF6082 family protein, partial [Micromonospora chalcea]